MTSEKLKSVRNLMKDHQVDAVIITGTDPHQSEYLAPLWQDRLWLTGFTGSSGSVIITPGEAVLVTDSRYTLQAGKEINPEEIKLIIQDNKIANGFIQIVKEYVSEGSTVLIDGFDLSIAQYRNYEKALGKNITIKTSPDIIGLAWADRPAYPTSRVYNLPDEIAGKSIASKLSDLRSFIQDNHLDAYLLCALDEIAWLLNMRGADVEFNPVFVAYLLVDKDGAQLFCNISRIEETSLTALEENGIHIQAYENIIPHLNWLATEQRLGLDAATTSTSIYQAINCRKSELDSPIPLWKSKKNLTEIVLTRNTMVKDGIALAKAFYWLHETLKTRSSSEYEFAQVLTRYRSEQAGFVGESFPPIVGFNGNGAIVHYRPTENNHASILSNGVLLVDSGGQYTEGTTDITRTIALGAVSKEARKAFTLVLKGVIALSRIIFPAGINGAQLDVLARQFLWENGLNYGHGTGHGVGFFLNVHEGPQSISPVINPRSKTPMEVGMITSNEPGYYLPDQFGIRVENLLLCQDHKDYEGFRHFETLTLYPIDIPMIDESLMDKKEKAWFNNYHHKVKSLILPHLEEPVKTWFELKCRPLN